MTKTLIRVNCGCGFYEFGEKALEAANSHASETRHTLTIMGVVTANVKDFPVRLDPPKLGKRPLPRKEESRYEVDETKGV